LTLPRCPEARGNIFNPDLTLTRKFFELSGHAGATLTGRVCAPSNGFRAAVYDSIGPPLALMTVNSDPVGSPNLNLRLKVGRGVPSKGEVGHQPHSSGGIQMVSEPFKRVESSVD
jgi:hypothetical protein